MFEALLFGKKKQEPTERDSAAIRAHLAMAAEDDAYIDNAENGGINTSVENDPLVSSTSSVGYYGGRPNHNINNSDNNNNNSKALSDNVTTLGDDLSFVRNWGKYATTEFLVLGIVAFNMSQMWPKVKEFGSSSGDEGEPGDDFDMSLSLDRLLLTVILPGLTSFAAQSVLEARAMRQMWDPKTRQKKLAQYRKEWELTDDVSFYAPAYMWAPLLFVFLNDLANAGFVTYAIYLGMRGIIGDESAIILAVILGGLTKFIAEGALSLGPVGVFAYKLEKYLFFPEHNLDVTKEQSHYRELQKDYPLMGKPALFFAYKEAWRSAQLCELLSSGLPGLAGRGVALAGTVGFVKFGFDSMVALLKAFVEAAGGDISKNKGDDLSANQTLFAIHIVAYAMIVPMILAGQGFPGTRMEYVISHPFKMLAEFLIRVERAGAWAIPAILLAMGELSLVAFANAKGVDLIFDTEDVNDVTEVLQFKTYAAITGLICGGLTNYFGPGWGMLEAVSKNPAMTAKSDAQIKAIQTQDDKNIDIRANNMQKAISTFMWEGVDNMTCHVRKSVTCSGIDSINPFTRCFGV